MKNRPIFYDTETTGVKSETDYIIEIAAYDPEKDATFEALIKPAIPIPQEASRIHGITDDMVADKPTFEEVGKNFIEFCSGPTVLIAHNNDRFDKHFLNQEFKRSNIENPEFTHFDSLKWARKYRPDLRTHTLQSLRELYGFEANNAHRALDDVIILHKVFQAMTGDLNIDQVIHLLNASNEIKRMPFGKHSGKPLNLVPKDYVSWLNKNGAFDKSENSDLKQAFEKLQMI